MIMMMMVMTMKSSACFLALPYLLVLQAWLSGLLHPGYRACTKDNFLQLPSVPMTYLSNVVIIMVMVIHGYGHGHRHCQRHRHQNKTTLPLACCWAVVSSGEGSESVHGPTENLK